MTGPTTSHHERAKPRSGSCALPTTIASALAAALVLLLAPHTAAAGDIEVGVVDFTLALQQTESAGALAQLEQDAKARQNELKELEDEIMSMEQELQENGPMLSKEKMKEKLMAYQKKAYEYRQRLLFNEKEFNDRKRKVLSEIHEVMQHISVEIAQENNLDLMIEKNEGAVIYFDNSFDYTAELVKRYEARRKGE